jgi:radical SAM superfamily enzyme YgiQ (UPF0313 family)
MKVAYIFSPPWDPKFPPYSMALFNASTKRQQHEFFGYDLNVDLYNIAQKEDKVLWEDQHSVQWQTRSDEIIQKYSLFLDSFIDRLLRQDTDLFAFSINAHSKMLALFLAKRIRFVVPDAMILFGGPQCFPSYDGVRILENECVDAICTGEGDSVWPAVLKLFSEHGSLSIDIPGIAYRREDGTIVDGGVPEVVNNLNEIPLADYRGLDLSGYNNLQLSTMTSRGCINTCAFCSERPNFIRYRYRDAQNIYDEILKHIEVVHQLKPLISRLLTQYRSARRRRPVSAHSRVLSVGQKAYSSSDLYSDGFLVALRSHLPLGELHKLLRHVVPAKWRRAIIPFINFNDSLINGMPKELDRLCDKIIDSGIIFHWAGMALIRKEMSRELLTKMKVAGCIHLAWGLESGCQRVLELMNKRFFDMDVAKIVIKDAYEVGINQSISLITGFPGETEEMFGETVVFLQEYKRYFSKIGVQPMMIVNNSIVYEKYQQYGIDYANSRDGLKWKSIDGSNNYEMRLERVEQLKSLLKDKIITIDK